MTEVWVIASCVNILNQGQCLTAVRTAVETGHFNMDFKSGPQLGAVRTFVPFHSCYCMGFSSVDAPVWGGNAGNGAPNVAFCLVGVRKGGQQGSILICWK